MSGRQFTWTNNLQKPTYEKFNRILESKFPHSMVQPLTREISDHTTLFLNIGDASTFSNPSMFKFELGWLLRHGFFDMVSDIWQSLQEGHTPLDKWQPKI